MASNSPSLLCKQKTLLTLYLHYGKSKQMEKLEKTSDFSCQHMKSVDEQVYDVHFVNLH